MQAKCRKLKSKNAHLLVYEHLRYYKYFYSRLFRPKILGFTLYASIIISTKYLRASKIFLNEPSKIGSAMIAIQANISGDLSKISIVQGANYNTCCCILLRMRKQKDGENKEKVDRKKTTYQCISCILCLWMYIFGHPVYKAKYSHAECNLYFHGIESNNKEACSNIRFPVFVITLFMALFPQLSDQWAPFVGLENGI